MPAVDPSVDIDPSQLCMLRRLVQRGSANVVTKNGESVELPSRVRTLIVEIARNMEAGKSVSVVAENHELTTQRAGKILGVSRPFFVRLLEEKKLPFHMVGSHPGVYLADLLEYKTKRDSARHNAIKRMARAEVAAGTYDTGILPDGATDE